MFSKSELDTEADRLFKELLEVHCQPDQKWTYEQCVAIAPLTLEITALKRQRRAVILAHSYVTPDIVYGVADLRGDSYGLSLEARHIDADVILFAGVVFMAETAKIICPETQVLVADRQSGCSLADSITADDVKVMKKEHPDAAVVCYINSTAAVKAECDVCVTSSNVYDIIAKLPQKKIIFVPDKLMAANIRQELAQRGCDKTIICSEGSCIAHAEFDPNVIAEERQRYPDLQVVSHPECSRAITSKSDYVGSTSGMMGFVKKSPSKYFMMLTECGLTSRLEAETHDKTFLASCKLCPYMKLNTLKKIRDALKAPSPENIIEVDEPTRLAAKRSIDAMFAMTQSSSGKP